MCAKAISQTRPMWRDRVTWMQLTVRLSGGLLIALGLATLLCACSVEQTLTIYPGEQWSAQSVLLFDAVREAQLLGNVEPQLQQMVAQHAQKGVQTTYRRELQGTNIAYILDSEGTGLARLNDVFFSNGAKINSNGELITFSYTRPYSFDQSAGYRLTVNGGQILNSNANSVSGGSAVWYDVKPGSAIFANLRPASRFNLLSFWPIAAGAIAIVGGTALTVVGLRRVRRVACRQCNTLNPRSAKFCRMCGSLMGIAPSFYAVGRLCPNCSTENKSDTRFCVQCGYQLV